VQQQQGRHKKPRPTKNKVGRGKKKKLAQELFPLEGEDGEGEEKVGVGEDEEEEEEEGGRGGQEAGEEREQCEMPMSRSRRAHVQADDGYVGATALLRPGVPAHQPPPRHRSHGSAGTCDGAAAKQNSRESRRNSRESRRRSRQQGAGKSGTGKSCKGRRRWRFLRELGQGCFGSVFAVLDRNTGKEVAFKQLHIPVPGKLAPLQEGEEGVGEADQQRRRRRREQQREREQLQARNRLLLQEVQMLKQLRHSNIVRYMGTYTASSAGGSANGGGGGVARRRGRLATASSQPRMFLVMELAEGGTVKQLMQRCWRSSTPNLLNDGSRGGGAASSVAAPSNTEGLPHWLVRAYLLQIVKGLAYLHSLGIVHRGAFVDCITMPPYCTRRLHDFTAPSYSLHSRYLHRFEMQQPLAR
jgi:hypothetical protein